MRTKLVVGNWKLNGSLAGNEALLKAVQAGVSAAKDRICAVCVPYPYLAQMGTLLRGTAIAWGSQDVSRHEKGAYTGEVSGAMVAELGARFAIAARKAGLTPIFCVGETLAEREAGVTESVLARQLDALLAKQGAAGLEGAVVAYEPVWAIGTGKTAT